MESDKMHLTRDDISQFFRSEVAYWLLPLVNLCFLVRKEQNMQRIPLTVYFVQHKNDKIGGK